jgi:hypothetical protein
MRSSSSCSFVVCTLIAAAWILPVVESFNLWMGEYQPPVKSSVSKLYDRRFPRDFSTGGKTPSRSSSREAYAGAIAQPTQTGTSFERRMRDLVLGTQSLTRPKPQVVRSPAAPANVLTIETLQEYKKVVGDENERMVAVRFYAPWCRVSHFHSLQLKFMIIWIYSCSNETLLRLGM